MSELNPAYWDNLYKQNLKAWDIGYISTPIKKYIDQLEDKSIHILIPGAGSGYEVEYLYSKGFENTFYLDFSEEAVKEFSERCPFFPDENILNTDFFSHRGSYDLILELAFFTSIIPEKRDALAQKIVELLKPGGKYAGVFFGHEFEYDHPPYGAIKEHYIELVKGLLEIKVLEPAYNSIKPRAGRELFFIFQKN
jgi:SAM-dependent methyltransferase